MKLAAYIRVSTERQAQTNDSMEGQVSKIEAWAKSNGHNIVKIYADPGASAFYGSRPVFDRMIGDVVTGEVQFEGIVVYSLSRFSRNEVCRLVAEDQLAKKNIRVFSCTEALPEDEDLAYLMRNILGSINEHQSRQNSKTVSDRLNHTASKGFHTGGGTPFGYLSIPAPRPEGGAVKKILVINPSEAEIVKLMFELAYSGDSGVGYGVKKIAYTLNQRGLLRGKRTWTTNTVHRILTDTIYMGERIFGKKRKRKDPWLEPVIVKVPEIVSREVFDRIRQQLAARAPQDLESKGLRSPSLLTGLLKCSKCGCNLVVQTGKSGRYEYYKCRNKVVRDNNCCSCPILPKKVLEAEVLRVLRTEILTEARIQATLEYLKEAIKSSTVADKKKLAVFQRQIKSQDVKIDTLYERIAEGQLEFDLTLLNYLNKLKVARDTYLRNASEIKQKLSLPIWKFGVQQIKEFTAAARRVLLGKDQEATKAYLRSVLTEITVAPNNLKLKGGKLKLVTTVSRFDRRHPLAAVPSVISNWR